MSSVYVAQPEPLTRLQFDIAQPVQGGVVLSMTHKMIGQATSQWAPLFQPLPLIFSPQLYPTEITCEPPFWKPCNLLNYFLAQLYHPSLVESTSLVKSTSPPPPPLPHLLSYVHLFIATKAQAPMQDRPTTITSCY